MDGGAWIGGGRHRRWGKTEDANIPGPRQQPHIGMIGVAHSVKQQWRGGNRGPGVATDRWRREEERGGWRTEEVKGGRGHREGLWVLEEAETELTR